MNSILDGEINQVQIFEEDNLFYKKTKSEAENVKSFAVKARFTR